MDTEKLNKQLQQTQCTIASGCHYCLTLRHYHSNSHEQVTERGRGTAVKLSTALIMITSFDVDEARTECKVLYVSIMNDDKTSLV